MSFGFRIKYSITFRYVLLQCIQSMQRPCFFDLILFSFFSLHVTDQEIQTKPWPRILEKLVRLQRTQRLCVVKDLTEHEVVMRIMRKENFLIGMLNKGVFGCPISWWVPGRGPGVNSRSSGRKNYLIFPKTLEWTLDWCIFESMFDK